jgi:predicted extracellular nuclease
MRPPLSASLFLMVAMAAVAAHAQEAPPACADGQCIQVGSYNIELLGSQRKPYAGMDRGPRTDAEIDRLAERIATELDLEIVVLEEINTHSNEWKRLRDRLAAHGYQFFEGTASERNQYVVLCWDADEVTLLDNSARELDVRTSFDLGHGCRESGLRKPVAGRFKAGQFDFWVVGVHLKSRSGGESCTQRVRSEQCKDLVAQIDALRSQFGEGDFLIVGDCNENLGHSSFAPLTEAGFISQMAFLLPNSAKGSYVKNGDLNRSDDLIDHVWLRYSETKEVVRPSAFVMPLSSEAEAKKYIVQQSDHVPVWVSFRTDEDLDGDDE